MKSERMKTELLTNVSHDIKTPLTAIVSYVDLLKQEPMPNEKAKEYLDVLDRQSARLKKLTEDLVEASKATTGNLTVDLQPTDVNVFLGQTTGEYEERLAAKQLALASPRRRERPLSPPTGRLLWRVFENLFSNIQKYAQPGTRVYLTCQATDEQVTIIFRNISAEPLNISADELMERFGPGRCFPEYRGERPGPLHRPEPHPAPARDLRPGGGRGPVQSHFDLPQAAGRGRITIRTNWMQGTAVFAAVPFA